jgi:hypothetical protein
MGGITFQPHLAEAVMAGTKTVTRRLCSDNRRSPWSREQCRLKVGRDYAVQPGRGKPAIGRAVVVSVNIGALGYLDDEEARREGSASADEFEATWRAINGRYDPDTLVWRVELKALPGSRPPVVEPSRQEVMYRRHVRTLRAGASC